MGRQRSTTILTLLVLLLVSVTGCVRSLQITDVQQDSQVQLKQKIIQAETSADGSGQKLTVISLHPGEMFSIYAIERDNNNNFVGNVEVSWVLVGGTGQLNILEDGKRANFTATTVGSGYIKFISSTDSGEVQVVVTASPTSHVSIETAADGSGTHINATAMTAGQTLTMYAVSRDASNNYVGNPSVTWTRSNTNGTLSVASGSSTVLTVTVAGTMTVTADHATLTDDTTGTLTITPATADHVGISSDLLATMPITTLSLLAGDNQSMYASSFDQYNNYIEPVSVSWTPSSVKGSFSFASGSSTTFTAQNTGTLTITADHATLTDRVTGTITINAGAKSYVKIMDAAGGSGAEVGASSMTVNTTLNLYAVSYDNYNNFVANEVVTWSTSGGGSFSQNNTASTVFTSPTTVQTLTVTATPGVITADSSGLITVTPAVISQIKIETAANGSGSEITTQTLNPTQTLSLYAVGRDQYSNFNSLVSATWSIDDVTIGSFSATPATSPIFTPDKTGTGTITATYNALSDTTGIITVNGNDTKLGVVDVANIDQTSFEVYVRYTGDYNANAVATTYYCNNTDSAGCDPEVSPVGTKVLAQGYAGYKWDAISLTGTDNPGEVLNVKVVISDANGVNGTSPFVTTVKIPNPTHIYRSVGVGQPDYLSSGGSEERMTISSGVATFTVAQNDLIGIGDVVPYDSNSDGTLDKLVFIHGRTSSTQYTVRTKNGQMPTDISNVTAWRIYRAYTSLNEAINTFATGTNLTAPLKGFDVAPIDLTAQTGGDYIWHIACISGSDTVAASSSNTKWITGRGNYLHIYTPTESNEVAVSARHKGIWSTKYYRHSVSSGRNIYTWLLRHIHIDGLQVENTGGGDGVYLYQVVEAFVSNNIIRSATQAGSGVLYRLPYQDPIHQGHSRIWNNLIKGFSTGINDWYTGGSIYNNTVVGAGDTGIYGRTRALKNNLVQGSGVKDYREVGSTNNYNNISSDATSPNVSLRSLTVSFVSAANQDYRPISTDTLAINQGVDLAADANLSFNTDNRGLPRSGSWDIGAYEYVPALILKSVSIWNRAETEFDMRVSYWADENSNGSVTAYYCNQTDAPGCDPLMGTSVALTRNTTLSTYDGQVFGLSSPNDPGDTLKIQIVATDGDGFSGSPLNTTALLENPKKIYRSVGPSNTSPLAQGSVIGALTISGTTATFAGDLATNVGVGDVIQYDSNNDGTVDKLAFISGRTDARTYLVFDAYGNTPQATAVANTTWKIFRAYNQLSALSNAYVGTENSGIDSALRNFDTWWNYLDLTQRNISLNIACYADGVDTSNLNVNGSSWITAKNNNIKIYTPTALSEVGVSQRHNGKWSTSGYRMQYNATWFNVLLLMDISHIQIEGLQIASTTTYNYHAVSIHCEACQKNAKIIFNDNIVANVTNGGGVRFNSQDTSYNHTFYVANNIIYNTLGDGLNLSYSASGFRHSAYVYNNTIFNSGSIGIRHIYGGSDSFKLYLNNNMVQNSVTSDYVVNPNSSAANISSDASSPNLSFRSLVPTFVDAANNDYHLDLADTIAGGQGVDLSSDANYPFNWDTDMQIRVAPWDIGADQN